MTASAGSREEADRMMEPVIEKVKELFGDNVYGVDIGSLQAALVAELQKKRAEGGHGGKLYRRTGVQADYRGGGRFPGVRLRDLLLRQPN